MDRYLLALGMAEPHSRLRDRVERLLKRGQEFRRGVSLKQLGVAAGMLAAAVFVAAQSPAWVAFAQDAIPAPAPSTAPQISPQVPPQPLRSQEVHEGTLSRLLQAQNGLDLQVPPADAARLADELARHAAEFEALDRQWRSLNENQVADLWRHYPMDAHQGWLSAERQFDRLSSRFFQLRESGKPLVQELIDAGMTNLTVDQIIEMSRTGVTPDYVRAIAETGWTNLSQDQIVALQRNGVSPAFLRSLKEAGLTDLTVDQVIAAARNGVTADDIKIARSYRSDMSLDDIIKLKRNGAL